MLLAMVVGLAASFTTAHAGGDKKGPPPTPKKKPVAKTVTPETSPKKEGFGRPATVDLDALEQIEDIKGRVFRAKQLASEKRWQALQEAMESGQLKKPSSVKRLFAAPQEPKLPKDIRRGSLFDDEENSTSCKEEGEKKRKRNDSDEDEDQDREFHRPVRRANVNPFIAFFKKHGIPMH